MLLKIQTLHNGTQSTNFVLVSKVLHISEAPGNYCHIPRRIGLEYLQVLTIVSFLTDWHKKKCTIACALLFNCKGLPTFDVYLEHETKQKWLLQSNPRST